jgi:hypothetical protein
MGSGAARVHPIGVMRTPPKGWRDRVFSAMSPTRSRIAKAAFRRVNSLPEMLPQVYVASAVLGMLMLAMAAFCTANAGRNHLSPWWIGTYVSLLTGFALLAQTTGPIAAVAASH